MGIATSRYLARLNTGRLSFDYDIYVAERRELAADLRSIAAAVQQHRYLQGSWQMAQGTAGLTAGLAGSVALLAATPVVAGVATAAICSLVGKSVAAASLASSAAKYTHGHVVDKDIAARLRNLHHIIESIAQKDDEMNRYFVVVAKKTNVESSPQSSFISACTDDVTLDENAVDNQTAKDTPQAAICACRALCKIWQDQDLASQKEKQIQILDLAVALMSSSGVVMGAHSIVQGHKRVRAADSLETALQQTADALDYETAEICKLDLRYLQCIPVPRQLPRGRLLHLDGGNGQVTMMVTFDHGPSASRVTTLKSDSTRSIRLPYGATNVRVTFQDLAGKPVHKVDRAHPQQPWIKDETGKPVCEECTFASGDGVDAVFVVKGSLTHAYIHMAWDFGRSSLLTDASSSPPLSSSPSSSSSSSSPREWEWWGNAEENGDKKENKQNLPLEVEQRQMGREVADPIHPNSCGVALCCLTPLELMPFPMAV